MVASDSGSIANSTRRNGLSLSRSSAPRSDTFGRSGAPPAAGVRTPGSWTNRTMISTPTMATQQLTTNTGS